jgi:hypothetical protein
MRAKLADMGLGIVAMPTIGASQAPADHGAIKGSAGIRPQEKQSTKPWKLRALSLVSATIAAALLVSAPPAAAASRSVNVHTTDNDRGGLLQARITYEKNKGGKSYSGNIQGRYEDVAEDGYCVQAFRTGDPDGGADKKVNRSSLGPPVCPKGKSQTFDYRYTKAREAAVQVCRVNSKTHQLANCSGWK